MLRLLVTPFESGTGETNALLLPYDSMNSPTVLRDDLLQACPDFSVHWNEEGNCFVEDDGSFTCCGVLAVFGYYLRDRFDGIAPESLQQVGRILDRAMDEGDADLRDSIAACFVENMENEPFTERLKEHLGPLVRGLFLDRP